MRVAMQGVFGAPPCELCVGNGIYEAMNYSDG